jgi:biotin carboxyl carrier protein
MTIYHVSVGEHQYQVEVSGGRLFVNGEPVQANLTAVNALGLYLFQRGAHHRQMHFTHLGNTFMALANGRQMVAQVERGSGKARTAKAAQAQVDVHAPMPGVVIKVLVEAGEMVEKGQAVVVMESMKMQMELRASFAGQVESIAVQPADQVEKGALLVKITV